MQSTAPIHIRSTVFSESMKGHFMILYLQASRVLFLQICYGPNIQHGELITIDFLLALNALFLTRKNLAVASLKVGGY